jgi:hypothetical protein
MGMQLHLLFNVTLKIVIQHTQKLVGQYFITAARSLVVLMILSSQEEYKMWKRPSYLS